MDIKWLNMLYIYEGKKTDLYDTNTDQMPCKLK